MNKDVAGASLQMTDIRDPDRWSQIKEFTREWPIYIVQICKNALTYNGWSVKTCIFTFKILVLVVFLQKKMKKSMFFCFFSNFFIHLSPDTSGISKNKKVSFLISECYAAISTYVLGIKSTTKPSISSGKNEIFIFMFF